MHCPLAERVRVDSVCHCLQIKFIALSVQSTYRFSVRTLRYCKFIDPGLETEVQYIIIIIIIIIIVVVFVVVVAIEERCLFHPIWHSL